MSLINFIDFFPGTFLRSALKKIGVDPNIKRIGVYKSAGKPSYTRVQIRSAIQMWQLPGSSLLHCSTPLLPKAGSLNMVLMSQSLHDCV